MGTGPADTWCYFRPDRQSHLCASSAAFPLTKAWITTGVQLTIALKGLCIRRLTIHLRMGIIMR